MVYKFNPFTGNLDLEGPVLTGTGTVSAAADGTEALPGIAFASDLNSGIYRPGADQLAISTSGTGRLFIDSSGRVGVGATASTWNLGRSIEIDGTDPVAIWNPGDGFNALSNIYYNSGYKFKTNGGYGLYYQQNTGSGDHVFNTTTATGTADGAATFSELARIDSSGRLLVGTSTAKGSFTLASGSHYSFVTPGAVIEKTDYVSDMGSEGFFRWRTFRSGKRYSAGVSGTATISLPSPSHLKVRILATSDSVGGRNYAYEAYVFTNDTTTTVDIIKETTRISSATPSVSGGNMTYTCPASLVNQSLIYVEVEQVSSQNDCSITFS